MRIYLQDLKDSKACDTVINLWHDGITSDQFKRKMLARCESYMVAAHVRYWLCKNMEQIGLTADDVYQDPQYYTDLDYLESLAKRVIRHYQAQRKNRTH